MYKSYVIFGMALVCCFNKTYAAEREVIKRIATQQFTTQADSNQLLFLNQHTDLQGKRHARYQQTYDGVPIWGAYVLKHRSSIGPEMMHGVLFHRLAEDLGEKPNFIQEKERILSWINATYPHTDKSAEDIQFIIYVDAKDKAHWAYKIHLSIIQDTATLPKQPTVIVDAVTFKIYQKWDDIKTLTQIHGVGFGGNARIGKVQYGPDSALLNLVRDDLRGRCLMQNEIVSVYDMRSQSSGPQSLVAFDCNEVLKSYWTGVNRDGYDAVNDAYSPSNDALYIGSAIDDMYIKWYHMHALGSELPKTLLMRVHYGKSFENAFWDGKQMFFGDGGKQMYPLVVVTVAAHEVAHGLTQHLSDLVYTEQSGALNEAFSDIAAQAVEYYLYGQSSWTIGADALKGDTKALRYMKNPALDGQSINHTKDYYKGLDVHYASGVYNRFFYLLANEKGWNTKKAFEIMLKANADYWVSTSNYEDAACGVLWAAEDLEYSLQKIQSSFKAVGIDVSSCGV